MDESDNTGKSRPESPADAKLGNELKNGLQLKQLTAPAQKGLVGIVIKTFEGAYYGRLIEKASNYLLRQGYGCLAGSSAESSSGAIAAWLCLAAVECDGFIIQSDTLDDDELSSLLDTYPTSVLMNRHIKQNSERCVYLDNVYGGELAASHLLSHGHTHLAVVTGPAGMIEVKDRLEGFEQVLARHDLTVSVVIEGDFRLEHGRLAIAQIIEENSEVTAIFFHNDEMAFGAMEQCRQLGISIPQDISIIGYDNLIPCNHVYPTLTSINQPLSDIGESAGRMLYRLIDKDAAIDNHEPVQTYFKPELVVRDSVAILDPNQSEKSLTNRETECLTWTARGKTSWEIAKIVGIAESTVCFHVKKAGIKLHSNNRTHAVALAIEKGMIKL